MNPLQQAIQLFQQGKFSDVITTLKPLTDANIKDATAWFLSATAHSMIGGNTLAITHYQKCTKLNPQYADAYNNLGVVYEEENRFKDAENAYRKALSIKKNYISASFNLANILQKQGQLPQAIQQYENTLRLDAAHLKALNNLGTLFLDQRKPEQAKVFFLRAQSLHPDDTAILVNLGKIYLQQEDHAQAISTLQKAISISPEQAEAYNNIGLVYKSLGEHQQAIHYLEKTLQLKPDYAEAQCNIGLIAQNLKNYEEAERRYLRAIELDPTLLTAYGNLSDLYKKQNKYDEALSVLKRALSINQNEADIHFHLAQLYLAQFNFSEGWPHYIWGARLSEPEYELPKNVLPASLDGKVITLHRDQGVGDEIFLLRFVTELFKRGAKVNYVSSEKTCSLLKDIAQLTVVTSPGAIKSKGQQILISHLPYVLECNSAEQIPPPLPLAPKPEYISKLKAQLSQFGPGPYIGLTWRAGTDKHGKLFKSLPVSELSFIRQRYPQASFVILQRKPEQQELDAVNIALGVETLDMNSLNDELDRMLALLSLLDNYIGVSNTNVHLRASLGLHSDVFIPHPPEWRWGKSGNTSPWFPKCRVFRQDLDGSWAQAISEWQKNTL